MPIPFPAPAGSLTFPRSPGAGGLSHPWSRGSAETRSRLIIPPGAHTQGRGWAVLRTQLQEPDNPAGLFRQRSVLRGGVGCPPPLTPDFLPPSSWQMAVSPAPPDGLVPPPPHGLQEVRGGSGVPGPDGEPQGRGEPGTSRQEAPSNLWRGAPQGGQCLRTHFPRSLPAHRNRKPHADKRLPRQTFLFPISKRKIANLLQLGWADVSICGVSGRERERFTLRRRERASLKRVRAAGPETRLTGHSAKLLTQDTHCLQCQLPEDLLSLSFPSERGAGEGVRAWEEKAGAGVPLERGRIIFGNRERQEPS